MSFNNGDLSSSLEGFFSKHSGFKQDDSDIPNPTQQSTIITSAPIEETPKERNLRIFYERLAELGINLDEMKDILECKDNILVGAGAGSGKTTAITLRLIRDALEGDMFQTRQIQTAHGLQTIQVPEKVLVATFLRSGAQDLQQSFYSWCKKLRLTGIDGSMFVFRTIHSEIMDAVKAMGVNINITSDSFSITKEAADFYDIRSTTATAKKITVDELKELEGIIAFARNRLDSERYSHPLMSEYKLDSIMLDALIARTKLIRNNGSGRMDFEDAQEMLLEALQKNPKVREFISNRYSRIIVDEFQDTSQLQYEVLKYYFANSKRVIVVGDDDQTIYSWRASDNTIITRKFSEDVASTTLHLTTNYRCKSNILDPVIPSLELNKNRLPKKLRAYKEGGEVNIIKNGDVSQLIKSIHADRLKNYSSGVLARVNADLLIPTILLELDGTLDFTVSKSVSMTSNLPKQVFGALKLVTQRIGGDFENLLKMFVPRYQWYEAKNLVTILNMNKSFSLFTLPDADLEHSVPNLYPFLKSLRSAYAIDEVSAYLFILMYLRDNTYKGDSAYSRNGRTLADFAYSLVTEHPKVSNLSLTQIDMLLSDTLPEKIRNRVKYAGESTIKLTTIHEAKGKEWDSVYVWNFTQGVFPYEVGKRAITKEELEEERRISYIAMTRAKEKLAIYTDATRPSQFLLEFDLTKIKGYAEQKVEDGVIMYQQRKKSPEEEQTTHKILTSYIRHLRESVTTASMDKLAVVDILENNFTVAEIVKKLDDVYGADIDVEFTSEMMETALESMVNQLLQSGNYNA